MSELACGVTLAFTVSPLPFPFLSPFELPLGTSAISFWDQRGSKSVLKSVFNSESDLHLSMHIAIFHYTHNYMEIFYIWC